MAKSTMLVVPPNAAARVPVSKSSELVVPPNGISRCVCTSIPPGSTYIPVASITRAAEVSGMPVRISLIRPASIRTSADLVSFAVITVPLRISVLGIGFLTSLPHSLRPRFGRPAGIDFLHGDAVFYRADQPAEVTAHAFHFIHARDACDRIHHLARIQFGDRRH